MDTMDSTSRAGQVFPTSTDSYPPSILHMFSNAKGDTLGMTTYAQLPGGQFGKMWQNNNMGQSPGAVQWLMVNMTDTGNPSVVQLRSINGNLRMIVYTPQPSGSYNHTWSSGDMGEGSGAIKWLTADMDGTGKSSIVQLRGDKGNLAMIVYSPQSDGSFKQTWNTKDIGERVGALAWLTVDMDNSGRTSIVQLWNNNVNDRLGMIVYSPQRDGSFLKSWRSGNMEQGGGAVAWLTAHMDNSGKTSIVQAWNNASRLAMIVYSPQSDGSFKQTWSTGNMGEGVGNLPWHTVDLDNSGKTSIVQLWNNNDRLGMIVYSPQSNGSFKEVWSNKNMGEGPGFEAWLTTSIVGEGAKTAILQMWRERSSLGMIAYAPQSNGSFKTMWRSNLSEEPKTVAWLATRPYSPLRRHTSYILASSAIDDSTSRTDGDGDYHNACQNDYRTDNETRYG